MQVACRDIAVANIRGAIKERQTLLQTKYNELKTASVDNSFLLDTVRDYARYLAYIKHQREAQYAGIKKLNDYIDRLSRDTDITEDMLRQTRTDQRALMRQMGLLRREIDGIIVDGADVPSDDATDPNWHQSPI